MIQMPQIDHDLLEELEEDYTPSAAAEANKATLVAAILERASVSYDEKELEKTDRVKSRHLRSLLHALQDVEERSDGGEPSSMSTATDKKGRRRR